MSLKSNCQCSTPEGNFDSKHREFNPPHRFTYWAYSLCEDYNMNLLRYFWFLTRQQPLNHWAFFPLRLNLQYSQLKDRSFTLSVPTTLPLSAFIPGRRFNSVARCGLADTWARLCVCTWIFLKMPETTVKSVGGWGPVLCNKLKAPRRLHLLWVKRFIQRFS